MRVLVTVASKHGATAEIGDAIARELADRDLEVTVRPPDEVEEAAGFDAFVIGSAVYAGRWQKAARQFVETNAAHLASRPVWLFSSGPIGDPPEPTADPVDVEDVMAATRARTHRLFPGRLQQSSLSFGERAIVAALRAEYGDFRDFADIRAWAAEIAGELADDAQPTDA
ncbi:MAG TPA: flavodoxin domain-containing protein [Acidimicrobiia bacterium]|nr:flavodoxin domain-containing protein [Acidimicrobiia bacterium]